MIITYKNVGCIKYAKLECIPGSLILIKGETNNGKSLMFYSLEDGLLNTSTFKTWINNQAKEENPKAFAEIVIENDDRSVYRISANEDGMKYTENEVSYEKTRRKTIFEVLEKSIQGFLYCPDEINPILNIVDENSGFFPIDRSDSQIFKTYERLLSLSCTQDIMRSIKLDQEDIETKIKEKSDCIQSFSDKKSKILEFLSSKINQESITKISSTLRAYSDFYNKKISLYNSTVKDATYINKVLSVGRFDCNEFDTSLFSKRLSILVSYNSLTKYFSIINSVQFITKEFDIKKHEKQIESFNKASLLLKDITYLEDCIIKDKEKLEHVKSVLKDINICPLCGNQLDI